MFLLTTTFKVHFIAPFNLHVLFAVRPRITQRGKRDTRFAHTKDAIMKTIIALAYVNAVVI